MKEIALYIAKILYGKDVSLNTLSGYDRCTVMFYAEEIMEIASATMQG